ncbi:hypothetical protein OHA72_48030 [Dactylosporangium sp. NBC_01737]|nr:hypothetical protein OHA72_48030 [Dactylosporangium sp. NBC_01737]
MGVVRAFADTGRPFPQRAWGGGTPAATALREQFRAVEHGA